MNIASLHLFYLKINQILYQKIEKKNIKYLKKEERIRTKSCPSQPLPKAHAIHTMTKKRIGQKLWTMVTWSLPYTTRVKSVAERHLADEASSVNEIQS